MIWICSRKKITSGFVYGNAIVDNAYSAVKDCCDGSDNSGEVYPWLIVVGACLVFGLSVAMYILKYYSSYSTSCGETEEYKVNEYEDSGENDDIAPLNTPESADHQINI